MRMEVVRKFMAPASAPIAAASPSTNTTSITSVNEDCIREMVQRMAKFEEATTARMTKLEEESTMKMAKLEEENAKLNHESTMRMTKLEEENANLKQRLEARCCF